MHGSVCCLVRSLWRKGTVVSAYVGQGDTTSSRCSANAIAERSPSSSLRLSPSQPSMPSCSSSKLQSGSASVMCRCPGPETHLFHRVGVYTVPAALTLLIIAVIQPGSQRKELLPWLPLFFAAVNIITLAVGKFNERARARPRPSTLEDGLGDVLFGTWSSRSSPERSTTPGMSSPQPSESASHGPAMYGRYGPPSQCSHRTGDSEMSLSDGPGCCRPAWDPATLSFFPGRGSLPAPPTSGPWESAGLAAIHGFDAPEMDLVSEASAATSRQPLLGEEPNT